MSKMFRVSHLVLESIFIQADSKEEALNIFEKEGAEECELLSTFIEEVR